jgi:hypothetical protein
MQVTFPYGFPMGFLAIRQFGFEKMDEEKNTEI